MSTDPILYTEAEATWSPAKAERIGPWTIRTGLGGGQRVSAASLDGEFDPSAIEAAEVSMAALHQPPLFMVKDGQDAFDAELDARGYLIVDPVVILRGDIDALAVPPEPISAFPVWPPLQIMLDIWDAGGIGPARINVMDRSCDPKTGILGRTDDRAAGAGFTAIHGDAAYVHALTVAPNRRRRGVAVNMMRAAACWAKAHGATTLSVLVTRGNTGALALYENLNMQVVGQYHYRAKPAQKDME